jgi:hypothetical protein
MTEQELYERLIDTQQRLIVELQIQNRELRERMRVWPKSQAEINRDAVRSVGYVHGAGGGTMAP